MKEIELVEEVRRRAGRPGKGVKAGIGDDCAVLAYDREHYLLWGADMLVEGTHFKTGGTALFKKIGRKAVAVNISDIAAMGGIPKYVLVSLGIPPGMKRSAVRGIYDGIFRICADYGIKAIGGDTNRSNKLVIDVSIMGMVEKSRLVRRSGAKEGDLVLITGRVRDGRKEHFDFTPRLKESRRLVRYYRISSMIDTSDGIAPDMRRLCSESGTGCRLIADRIPLSEGLTLRDALYFGESFELLFTMSPPEARRLLANTGSRRKRLPYFVIGSITEKKEGMRLVGKNGASRALGKEGFRHF